MSEHEKIKIGNGNSKITDLENFLDWLKTCPYTGVISSMQGSFVHVKFIIDKQIKNRINPQTYEPWRKERENG